MTTTKQVSSGLAQKDFELIERIVWKNSDDLAVSVARSFERMEERIDALESRLCSGLADVSDQISETAEKATVPINSN